MSTIDQELRELQRDYLNDVREKLTLIQQHGEALQDGSRFKTSFPVLLFLVHQLKGSGGSLGFPRITEVAKAIAAELNTFLDDASPRPSPSELSESVGKSALQLQSAIEESEKSLL